MEYQQSSIKKLLVSNEKMQYKRILKYKINNQLNKNSITCKKKIWYNLIVKNGNNWQFNIKHLRNQKFKIYVKF